MIVYNDELNEQIISFINACIGVEKKMSIFNLNVVAKPPFDSRRIEFKLSNFIGTGHIYVDNEKSGTTYKTKTTADYRCQLIIRVFDTAKEVEFLSGRITGGLQTFEFLDNYMRNISVKLETVRARPFVYERDNTIVNFKEITAECCVTHEFTGDIPYFDNIQETVYDIK